MNAPELRCPATGRLVTEPSRDSGCARCELHLGGQGVPLALYWCGATRAPSSVVAEGPRDTRAVATLPDANASSAARAPRAQTRFPGYTVEGILGRGGGGVVYRVHSHALKRTLALKVLNAGAVPNDRGHSRFLREIALTLSLEDPGVVRVVDSGVTPDGTPWYAMELVEGTTLAEVLKSPLRPPLSALLRVVHDIAETLGRLHRRGIFHRDVKPGNVLITRQGKALLSDFGIALDEEADRLTRTPQPMGTPRYMAPEQARCAVEDWKRVDVFALGVVLAECVAARRPDDPLPRRLTWIVARATSPVALDRHPDMGAMVDDLDALRARPWSLAAARMAARMTAKRVGRSGLRSALVAGVVAAIAWPGAVHWQALRRESESWDAWVSVRAQVDALSTSGTPVEAEALLTRFSARNDVHGTRARIGSLAALADVRMRRGDVGLALETALSGLAEARDDAERTDPLRLAIEMARQGQRWSLLSRLLTLAEANDWPVDPALGAAARADVSLAFGHLAEARLPPAARSLLAPVETGHGLELGGTLRVDLRRPGVTSRVVAVPGLSAPERTSGGWRIPAGWPAWGGEPDGLGALTQAENGDLLALGRSVEVVAPALDARVADALVVEGRIFLGFAGLERPLAEWRAGRLMVPDPQTESLGFHLLGLDSGDLDADGRPELIASLGPPQGMMVRTWRLTDGGLERSAERRVGYVRLAGVLPATPGHSARIVAMRENRHPAWPLFGRTEPDGGPCGVLLLERRGPALEVVQEMPYRTPEALCPCANGGIVDLDRDALADVVLSFTDDAGPAPEHTWIYRQQADGTLAPPLRLGGLRLVAQAPPTTERGPMLLVQVGPDANRAKLWQAGDGGSPLPDLPLPAPRAAEPSSCGWLFAALGLDGEAARACEVAATTTASPARPLVGAARAWLASGQPARVLDVLDRMPDGVDDTSAVALRRTAFEALAATDPEIAAHRPDFDSTSAAVGFRGWLAEVTHPTVKVLLGRSLPESWLSAVPQATRHDVLAERLTLRIPAGAGPVMRIPLTATGGRVWMNVAGLWQRGEWASHARFILRPRAASPRNALPNRAGAEAAEPPRGPGLVFDLATKGGSGTLSRYIDGTCGLVEQRAEVDDALPFVLRGGTGPEGLLAGHTSLGGSEFDIRGPEFAAARAGEPWEFVIEGSRPLMDAVGQITALSIRRLELAGFDIAPEAAAPRTAWTRWALGGALPDALSTTVVGPQEAAGNPLGPSDIDELAQLARLDPTLIHRLRASLGEPAAATVHARAWAHGADVHRDDPEIQENLRSPPPLTTLPAATQARLAVGQAAALLASGELVAADNALRRAQPLAEAAGPDAWRDGFDAAAMRAELALAQGDPDGARVSLSRALAWAPDEDLGRRLLRHRPRLAPLLGKTGWPQLTPE